MVQDEGWFGYSAPAFAGDGLVAPVLGTLVYLYGSWPFLAGAAEEVLGRRPGMMLLIAMAITVASPPAGLRRSGSSGWTSGGSSPT